MRQNWWGDNTIKIGVEKSLNVKEKYKNKHIAYPYINFGVVHFCLQIQYSFASGTTNADSAAYGLEEKKRKMAGDIQGDYVESWFRWGDEKTLNKLLMRFGFVCLGELTLNLILSCCLRCSASISTEGTTFELFHWWTNRHSCYFIGNISFDFKGCIALFNSRSSRFGCFLLFRNRIDVSAGWGVIRIRWIIHGTESGSMRKRILFCRVLHNSSRCT